MLVNFVKAKMASILVILFIMATVTMGNPSYCDHLFGIPDVRKILRNDDASDHVDDSGTKTPKLPNYMEELHSQLMQTNQLDRWSDDYKGHRSILPIAAKQVTSMEMNRLRIRFDFRFCLECRCNDVTAYILVLQKNRHSTVDYHTYKVKASLNPSEEQLSKMTTHREMLLSVHYDVFDFTNHIDPETESLYVDVHFLTKERSTNFSSVYLLEDNNTPMLLLYVSYRSDIPLLLSSRYLQAEPEITYRYKAVNDKGCGLRSWKTTLDDVFGKENGTIMGGVQELAYCEGDCMPGLLQNVTDFSFTAHARFNAFFRSKIIEGLSMDYVPLPKCVAASFRPLRLRHKLKGKSGQKFERMMVIPLAIPTSCACV